jgi:hypothetical protein
MTEQQNQAEFSPAVQQALSKLNVRMVDLMEQINIVIKMLVDENMELRTKLASVQSQRQSNAENVKK